jgi:uncharacterized protein
MISPPTNRLFPPPRRPAVMFMRWVDLLFMHWEMDPQVLRDALPSELELDLHDGRAYIAVVPFLMTKTRPRLLPPVPGLSTFGEINVRTYARHQGRPGVYFFTLDAHSHLAVWGARVGFHLNYLHSRLAIKSRDGWVHYRSTRTSNPRPAEFVGQYRPVGNVFHPRSGSLEYFLTERYLLFAVHKGRVFHGDIDHPPWPLQTAECQIQQNTMTRPLGITLPDAPPLLHYSARQDVWAWWRVRR